MTHANAATAAAPGVTIDWDEPSGVLALSGALAIHQLTQVKQRFVKLHDDKAQLSRIDISKLDHIDTAGALLLAHWASNIPLTYKDDAQKELLALIAGLDLGTAKREKKKSTLHTTLVAIGKNTEGVRQEACHMLSFTGKTAVVLVRALRYPKHLRIGAIAQHIEQIGIHALPIIGLMAFLISIVLAYQGVAQLRPYGGEQFTVNLVALSILREMGVLLTAIMVAGRSGSAFTAEIGVMKAREEVDALQVMGLSPFDMLVTPRIIAILIALPLLTFFADMMGLLGGFIICHSLIGITLEQYIDRVHNAVSGSDVFVGMFKAPVFAFFIGITGCMHGLRVNGSAESIGRETTASVVKSIFLVLVLDAFFSIFFEQVGL